MDEQEEAEFHVAMCLPGQDEYQEINWPKSAPVPQLGDTYMLPCEEHSYHPFEVIDTFWAGGQDDDGVQHVEYHFALGAPGEEEPEDDD